MARLRCNKCDWSQDDFWDKGYNPLDDVVMGGLVEALLSEKWLPVSPEWLRHSDVPFKDVRVSRAVRQRDETEATVTNQPESALIEYEEYEVEPKAYVACELRRRIKTIEKMRWRTQAEWKKDDDASKGQCLRCGSWKDWDID